MIKDEKIISLIKSKNDLNTELLQKTLKLNENDIYLKILLKEKDYLNNKLNINLNKNSDMNKHISKDSYIDNNNSHKHKIINNIKNFNVTNENYKVDHDDAAKTIINTDIDIYSDNTINNIVNFENNKENNNMS
jgi:hypothetical protein